MASPVAEHRLWTRRLSGHGSQNQLLCGTWNLPGPGHEPVPPASAGGLSTTAPPEKPLSLFLYDFYYLCIFFGGMSVQIMLFMFMLRGTLSPQDLLGLWLLEHMGLSPR